MTFDEHATDEWTCGIVWIISLNIDLFDSMEIRVGLAQLLFKNDVTSIIDLGSE